MASLNDAHRALIQTLCKGDESAAAFLEMIGEVLHFWDDLVDRDHALDDATIHANMMYALIGLPRNAFYRANFELLNSMLLVAIQNWKVANFLERRGGDSEDGDLHVAFILRSSYVDLFTMTATLLGGAAWGETMALAIRQLAHSEGFGHYLMALENEAEKREKTLQ